MLYQDADDKTGKKISSLTLMRPSAPTTDRINVVVQLDRYKGGFNGGNWTSSRRYLLNVREQQPEPDTSLSSCPRPSRSMSSGGDTLVDFLPPGRRRATRRQVSRHPLRPWLGLAWRVVRPGPRARQQVDRRGAVVQPGNRR